MVQAHPTVLPTVSESLKWILTTLDLISIQYFVFQYHLDPIIFIFLAEK